MCHAMDLNLDCLTVPMELLTDSTVVTLLMLGYNVQHVSMYQISTSVVTGVSPSVS